MHPLPEQTIIRYRDALGGPLRERGIVQTARKEVRGYRSFLYTGLVDHSLGRP
jgi:hypothetical protein